VGTNEKSKGQPLDIRSLKESREFTIVFNNDKGMKCRLIEADNYNLLVSWDDKRVLIPKHSIKYVIL
jgi:sRNA-binding regulator protein Hfq